MRKLIGNISLIAFFLCLLLFEGQAQTSKNTTDYPFYIENSEKWVDSVFKKMTAEEKITQMMMIRVLSNKPKRYEDSIAWSIKKYRVGGLIFFQGGPVRQAKMTNRYQAEAKVPLLIAIDGEWGLGMRLDSTISFPYQMSLGAIQDDSLIYKMGLAVAEHCRRIGIHVNFAPVVDVNNNPKNPVISYRSFGENKEKVAFKSYMYMKGMQDGGILTTAKHFPGHGDTDVDSHLGLPLISHNRDRLDSMELYPFKYLFSKGLSGLMVAHLSIPSLDDTPNLPSTLSKPIISDLLKKELGFNGLIFTDALDMKGVTKFHEPGELDVKAVIAGNDVLELSEDIPAAVEAIKAAVKEGRIKQSEIDSRCKKILTAKYYAGLNNYQPVELDNLVNDLNNPASQVLNRKLTEASLTVLKNDKNLLPFQRLDTLNIATVSLNTDQITPFQQMLENYTSVRNFQLSPKPTKELVEKVRRGIEGADYVIVGVHQNGRPRNLVLDSMTMTFLNEINNSERSILALFTNGYSPSISPSIAKARAIVISYQDTRNTQELTAQLLFGAIGCNGKLPVTANSSFTFNSGMVLNPTNRLKYSIPEEVGMDSKKLSEIDSLVNEAIRKKAVPGCQILAAKNGVVIYNKSFGHHTFENKRQVLNSDVYDLASVTKVIGSLPALMKLYDQGKLNLDGTLGDYFSELKGSNKENLKLRDVLTHQARLKSWIPFWQNTLKKKYRSGKARGDETRKFKWFTFKSDSSKRFPIKVSEDLYLHRKYSNKLFKEIKKSPLNEKAGYVYSDLSFYLYPKLIKKVTGIDFEDYLKDSLYQALGAYSLTFNPYLHYPKDQIVPTEYDSIFRKELIHGRVHDEGAAMLNGLSGHAGLFGTANDVAKLMQLYLQKGEYGDKKFIKPQTMDEFTRCQFCDDNNRRALGFDRPVSPPSANGNAAVSASSKSYGHTGFTGIFTWVDPETELVYVFLSNRVYPTRNNTTLFKLNTRTNIQEVFYKAMIK